MFHFVVLSETMSKEGKSQAFELEDPVCPRSEPVSWSGAVAVCTNSSSTWITKESSIKPQEFSVSISIFWVECLVSDPLSAHSGILKANCHIRGHHLSWASDTF